MGVEIILGKGRQYAISKIPNSCQYRVRFHLKQAEIFQPYVSEDAGLSTAEPELSKGGRIL